MTNHCDSCKHFTMGTDGGTTSRNSGKSRHGQRIGPCEQADC